MNISYKFKSPEMKGMKLYCIKTKMYMFLVKSQTSSMRNIYCSQHEKDLFIIDHAEKAERKSLGWAWKYCDQGEVGE